MAPVLQKGLLCCVSLRTCALILGSINLVSSVLTLTLFILGLSTWAPEEGLGSELDGADPHLEHSHEHHAEYDDGVVDSEAMDELVRSATQLALAALWVDFVLVILETISVVFLLWGAAKRIATLLLPWLAVEVLTTLYDVAFFCYLYASEVYIAIDLLPLIVLPLTIYCWLVVFSLYQEFREAAARNEAMPLSALETGQEVTAPCTVPYGRMPSRG